jgi:hypothetical protein
MLENVIIFLHIIAIFFTAFYAFLFKKNWFDYVYLAIFYIMLLHWTFLHGECIITFSSKYLVNPDYLPGEDVHNDDMKRAFGKYETAYPIINAIKNILTFLGFYLVCIRNRISAFFYVPFVFLLIIYRYVVSEIEVPYKNESFLLFQDIVKYILIIGGILFLFRRRIF